MSRRKQLNPKALKEGEEDNEDIMNTIKRMRRNESNDEEDDNISINQSINLIKEESIDNDLSLIQCVLCNDHFETVALLQMHTISVHVPQPSPSLLSSFECPQCNSILPSLSLFAIHMKYHISEKSYTCNQCMKNFQSEQEWSNHMVDHYIIRSSRLQCTFCSTKEGEHIDFIDQSQLISHLIDDHVSFHILCKICDKIFQDQFQFRLHSIEHCKRLTTYLCTQCEMSFTNEDEVHCHIKIVHSNNQLISSSTYMNGTNENVQKEDRVSRSFNCTVCDEKCIGEDGLDEHRLIQHCKIARADNCAICHLPIKTANDFILHCQQHRTDGQMSCVVCRQNMRSDTQVQMHATFHTFDKRSQSPSIKKEESIPSSPNQSISAFPCTICGLSFSSLSSVHSHSSSHKLQSSSTQNVFKCHICAFRFNSQSRLDTHIRKHSNTMNATCQICSDQFPKQEDLVVHMRIHKDNLTERSKEPIIVNGQ